MCAHVNALLMSHITLPSPLPMKPTIVRVACKTPIRYILHFD